MLRQFQLVCAEACRHIAHLERIDLHRHFGKDLLCLLNRAFQQVLRVRLIGLFSFVENCLCRIQHCLKLPVDLRNFRGRLVVGCNGVIIILRSGIIGFHRGGRLCSCTPDCIYEKACCQHQKGRRYTDGFFLHNPFPP